MSVNARTAWAGRAVGCAFLVGAIGAALAIVAAPTLAEKPRQTLRASSKPIEIVAERIRGFDKSRPEARRFGKLEWLGGLVLSSSVPEFGGWSGLLLDATGKSLIAVSDAASWLTAELDQDDDGRPVRLRSARLGPILGTNGKPLTRRRDIDAESIRFAGPPSSRGEAFIGFESNHRIAVAETGPNGVAAPKRFIASPPGAKRMTRNEGFEALAVLQAGPFAGSLVAFSERLPDPQGRHTGWIWVKGKPAVLKLANSDDFSVTDAVGLKDGGLLVLERRFRILDGVRMRLRHIAAEDIGPGAALDGEVLLAADQSREIDNMEALAVHERPGGETVLTLLSDNNFNPLLQRTLLLRFVWRRDGVARAEK